MLYYVTLGTRSFEVELSADGVRVDGQPVEVSMGRADGTPVRGLVVNHETYRLVASRDGRGKWGLLLRGSALEADVVDARTKAIRDITGAGASAPGPRPVVAPMPGMVVKVEVVEGDCVESGQGVVIVEAMKMENELKALVAGRVTRVHVREGDAVEKDQVLVDLAPIEARED